MTSSTEWPAEARDLVKLIAEGFMTCNSNGSAKKYDVTIEFDSLSKAQKLHCFLFNLVQSIPTVER